MLRERWDPPVSDGGRFSVPPVELFPKMMIIRLPPSANTSIGASPTSINWKLVASQVPAIEFGSVDSQPAANPAMDNRRTGRSSRYAIDDACWRMIPNLATPIDAQSTHDHDCRALPVRDRGRPRENR